MTLLLRLALAVLFATELVVGAWNQFAPASFYTDFPTVDLTPPFSEHYARDFGGATLGLALLLGLALVRPRLHFVLPAVLAYEVYAIPHFVFHLAHLEHATAREAVALTAANAAVVLVGVLAVVLVVARDRRTRATRSPAEAPDTPRLTSTRA